MTTLDPEKQNKQNNKRWSRYGGGGEMTCNDTPNPAAYSTTF